MIWHPYRILGQLAAILLLAILPAALLLGISGALAAALAVLVGWLAWHVREFVRLVRWLGSPEGTGTPDGRGVWAAVFSTLERRAARERESFDRTIRHLDSFQTALEALPDGIIKCDREFRIRWMNPLAARQLAIDPSIDRGRFLVHLVRSPDFVAYIHAGCFDDPCILRCHRGSGAILAIRVVAHGAEGFLIVSHDISDSERVETMRRDFVANVSHELKTPLTIINGFAETLIDGLPDRGGDDAARYVGLIHEQSQRMDKIIRDLLTLASLEQADAGDSMPLVDMEALCLAVVRDAVALSGGRHRIESRIDRDLPGMRGRPTELLLAFGNLVGNAVRYTPEGGCIRIALRASGHGAEFAVEDTGYGIAPEHIPRLTERFYRVPHGPAAAKGGTGLGLAIVKHVLARHGGELQVTSEPGVGSRFVACFPVECLAADAAPECDEIDAVHAP